MSRVTINELLPGAVNDAADANSTLTRWENVSADVDGQNIREEGIERRNIVYPSVALIGDPGSDAAYLHRYNTNSNTVDVQSVYATGIPVTLGGVGSNPQIAIGPIRFDNVNQPNDMGIVRFSGEFMIDSSSASKHSTMYFTMCYIESGSPTNPNQFWTDISKTERQMRYLRDEIDRGFPFRGSLTVAHLFSPTIDINAYNLYFGVKIWLSTSGGDQWCRIRRASLSYVSFRK